MYLSIRLPLESDAVLGDEPLVTFRPRALAQLDGLEAQERQVLASVRCPHVSFPFTVKTVTCFCGFMGIVCPWKIAAMTKISVSAKSPARVVTFLISLPL